MIAKIQVKAQGPRLAGCLNWRGGIARLEGAYSENTLRSYRADFAAFEAWCRASRLRPLPASPQAVAAFITAVAPKFSPSTLRRRLGGIRKVQTPLFQRFSRFGYR